MRQICLIGFAANIVLLIALVLALLPSGSLMLPSVRDVMLAVVMVSAFIALIANTLIKTWNHHPQH